MLTKKGLQGPNSRTSQYLHIKDKKKNGQNWHYIFAGGCVGLQPRDSAVDRIRIWWHLEERSKNRFYRFGDLRLIWKKTPSFRWIRLTFGKIRNMVTFFANKSEWLEYYTQKRTLHLKCNKICYVLPKVFNP